MDYIFHTFVNPKTSQLSVAKHPDSTSSHYISIRDTWNYSLEPESKTHYFYTKPRLIFWPPKMKPPNSLELEPSIEDLADLWVDQLTGDRVSSKNALERKDHSVQNLHDHPTNCLINQKKGSPVYLVEVAEFQTISPQTDKVSLTIKVIIKQKIGQSIHRFTYHRRPSALILNRLLLSRS